MKYEVWTDGGCSPNPGAGGWCAIIMEGPKRVVTLIGGEPETTNNRMEFMSAIEALMWAPKGSTVNIHSDSQLLVRIAGGQYKAKKNRDLVQSLFELMNTRTVDFKWVRGHSGNALNEECDRWAGYAISQTRMTHDSWVREVSL